MIGWKSRGGGVFGSAYLVSKMTSMLWRLFYHRGDVYHFDRVPIVVVCRGMIHVLSPQAEQRDEAVAKRFIGKMEASISKLAIVPDSSPITAKLVLIFWALSL